MRRSLRLNALLLVFVSACGLLTEGKEEWSLEVNTAGSGSGTVLLSPPGGQYETGTLVTITATPNEGSVFTGWDAATDASGTIPAACLQAVNPCTTGKSGRQSVVATFAPATGVARFNGAYFGPHFNNVGSSPPGAIQLTITNGTVSGTVAAMLTPSPGVLTGTVSADGTFIATAPNNVGGICGSMTVVFSGQITTALLNGITTATITGSITTQGSPPQGCGVSAGSFTVNRRTVPFEATGV